MNIIKSSMIQFSAISLTVVVLAMSCKSKDDEPTPTLSITPSVTDVVFSADGFRLTSSGGEIIPSRTITVNTNQKDWDALPSHTWVQVSKSGSDLILSAQFGATEPVAAQVTITAGKATPVQIGVTVTDSKTGLLSEKMETAWDVTWQRFYLPETGNFYDYLSSFEPGKYLSHLPKAEEAMRQHPDRMGYGTGMENCMISAGVLMEMVVDRYAVTNDESLKGKALSIFEGMKRCATVHGIPGFLARCLCPEDGKSFYVTSSRDQYTHSVFGLWVYYHSPLCDEATKKEIEEIIAEIAERAIQNVVPENDYDMLSADVSRSPTPNSPYALCKMWNVAPHSAARLPMIYAAAWDMTGNKKYFDEYQKYLDPAIDQSDFNRNSSPTYSIFQMQLSLVLLKALETDPERIKKIDRIMNNVSVFSRERMNNHILEVQKADFTELLGYNWRMGRKPYPGGSIWQVGNATLSQLMDCQTDFPAEQKELLVWLIEYIDFDHFLGAGIFELLGAYWKARRVGLLNGEEIIAFQ